MLSTTRGFPVANFDRDLRRCFINEKALYLAVTRSSSFFYVCESPHTRRGLFRHFRAFLWCADCADRSPFFSHGNPWIASFFWLQLLETDRLPSPSRPLFGCAYCAYRALFLARISATWPQTLRFSRVRFVRFGLFLRWRISATCQSFFDRFGLVCACGPVSPSLVIPCLAAFFAAGRPGLRR